MSSENENNSLSVNRCDYSHQIKSNDNVIRTELLEVGSFKLYCFSSPDSKSIYSFLVNFLILTPLLGFEIYVILLYLPKSVLRT